MPNASLLGAIGRGVGWFVLAIFALYGLCGLFLWLVPEKRPTSDARDRLPHEAIPNPDGWTDDDPFAS